MFGAPFCFVGIILMISIIGFPLGLILIGFSGFPLKIVESHRITKIVAWNKFTEPSDLDEFINMPTPWEK